MGWKDCIFLEIDESLKNINIEQNKYKPGCFSYEILEEQEQLMRETLVEITNECRSCYFVLLLM
jgi:hypothetical protein